MLLLLLLLLLPLLLLRRGAPNRKCHFRTGVYEKENYYSPCLR
jgi:hypothetical protein